jgi:hypothetical protein
MRGHHDHVDLDRPAVVVAGYPLDFIDPLLGVEPEESVFVLGGHPEPDPLAELHGSVAELGEPGVRAARPGVLVLDRGTVGDICAGEWRMLRIAVPSAEDERLEQEKAFLARLAEIRARSEAARGIAPAEPEPAKPLSLADELRKMGLM